MKKFLFRLLFLIESVIVLFFLRDKARQAWEGFHYDTFNVFHWRDIRFTDAEPNKNFIKTSYILENPKKFNAFVFGSSRVKYLPPDMFPSKIGETELRWYNMTHASAFIIENYMTLKTFIDNHVDVKMIALGFDDLSLTSTIDIRKNDLMRVPYQEIEKNKLKYLLAYLSVKTDKSIVDCIDSYEEEAHKEESEIFYSWGGNLFDGSLTEAPDLSKYEPQILPAPKEVKAYALDSIKAVVALCAEHDIKLVLFTNPLYKTKFKNAIDSGYFEFMRAAAQVTDFYNFSTLNNYTKDTRYYYEWSHYRPALGLLVEKMLFGTEDEKKRIRQAAGDELWGAKVNAENVDFVIQRLREQLEKSE